MLVSFTICDRWGADCPLVKVERGFRVQWRLVRHFSASRKITSLPPETDVSLLTPIGGIQGCLTALMQRADTFFIGYML